MSTFPTDQLAEEIWRHEDRFNEWLSKECLSTIAELVGLTTLTLESTKARVGDFESDIVCTDQSEHVVLIESQFYLSNHDHLGKIITYAAGTVPDHNQFVCIWLAEDFRQEHRKAIHWLNRMESGSFFGIEFQSFADSSGLPKIVCELVSDPDGFRSAERDSSSVRKRKNAKLHAAYWKKLQEKLVVYQTEFQISEDRTQHFYRQQLCDGVRLAVSIGADKGYARVELYIDGDGRFKVFDGLESDKESIHEELGYSLHWDRAKNRQFSKIEVQTNVNVRNSDDWVEQHDWFCQRIVDFLGVFQPRLNAALRNSYHGDQ